jgi:hypothetical protein
MTILTEKIYPAEFILSEAPGKRSRTLVTIGLSQTLKAGAVLGAVLLGALSAAAAVAQAGNTGNGVFGAATVDAGAQTGDYKIVFIEPNTNLGNFQVVRPDGTVDGTGKVGTAYDGMINFTIADGATDFASGDLFTVTVSAAAATKVYKAINLAAVDGTQTVAGILYAAVTTDGSTTQKAVVIDADAEVNGGLLDYNGQTTATVNAGLLALGIKVRT